MVHGGAFVSGSEEGGFVSPTAIIVGIPRNAFYVADFLSGRISKFATANGAFSRGIGEGSFSAVFGMGFDPVAGVLYVGESSRIQKVVGR